MESINWYDLSNYGVSLKILPKTPYRQTLTCLDVNDQAKYESHFEGQTNKKDALETLKELGFGTSTTKPFLRLYSQKTSYTLEEIRQICPLVNEGDCHPMPVGEVIGNYKAFKIKEWMEFARNVLAKETQAVWTPINNPYDKAYSESSNIPVMTSKSHPIIKKNALTITDSSISMYLKLVAAHYRQNLLIPLYADIQTAEASGYQKSQLRQVDLPYALPIFVNQNSAIIAIRDVRYIGEIMDIVPEDYYGYALHHGIVVNALRDLGSFKKIIESEKDKWKECVEQRNKASIELIDQSFLSVITQAKQIAEHYPVMPTIPTAIDNISKGMQGNNKRKIIDKEIKALSSFFGDYLFCEDEESKEQLLFTLSEIFTIRNETYRNVTRQTVVEEASIESKKLNDDVTSNSNTRHDDVGEKIGGARKDFARRALSIEDYEVMNKIEKTALVIKKNIWPPLNYTMMREDGATPEAAMAIKIVKDAIKPEPAIYEGEQDYETYIKAVSIVRDNMQSVKTLDEFYSALKNIYQLGALAKGVQEGLVYGSPIQKQWGRKASELIYYESDGWGTKIKRAIHYKVQWHGKVDEPDKLWRNLIKGKAPKTTEEADEDKKKQEQYRELHCPHLEHIERQGTDWREGKDIDGNQLLKHFGFRAIEYGNWLPQEERQAVLNMAFDSLNDLATALEIPPKGISFNGELAIAFGSRGRGGKNAAMAHFEPARFVVNLTRLKGAGSLAHEWSHALDYYLGNKQVYLSENPNVYRSSAMTALAKALKNRFATMDEIIDTSTKNARRGYDNMHSWLYHQSKESKENIRQQTEMLFDKTNVKFYEDALERIKQRLDRPGFDEDGVYHNAVASSLTAELNEEITRVIYDGCDDAKSHRKVRKNLTANINFMLRNQAILATASVLKDMEIEPPKMFASYNTRETEFNKQAQQLDKGRAKPYWATTRELFARAGAAYIYDKLAAKGMQSDYLVYGADESRYIDHPVGNPNPIGEDRKDYFKHYGELLSEYRYQCIKALDKPEENENNEDSLMMELG